MTDNARAARMRALTAVQIGAAFAVPMDLIDGRPWVATEAEADPSPSARPRPLRDDDPPHRDPYEWPHIETVTLPEGSPL